MSADNIGQYVNVIVLSFIESTLKKKCVKAKSILVSEKVLKVVLYGTHNKLSSSIPTILK